VVLLLLLHGQYKSYTQLLVVEVCCKNRMLSKHVLNAEKQRTGTSLIQATLVFSLLHVQQKSHHHAASQVQHC
jgi:hypothetical protein